MLLPKDNPNWPSSYQQDIDGAGGPKAWLEKKWQSHQPVYNVIQRLLPNKGKMMEIGCGLAATSNAMNLRGFTNSALDIDPKMLAIAQTVAQTAGTSIEFVQGDMFDLNKFYGLFDIVYSGGVLEHLDKTEAIKLLQEQAKIAPLVVTVIPTKNEKKSSPISRYSYEIKDLISFGNEAGLKPFAIFIFKGVDFQYHQLDEENLSIESLDQLPAERIGIVYFK